MEQEAFHFEQPKAKKSTKVKKTGNQLRTESIERRFAEKTDRQLLEEQVHLARLYNEKLGSIKDNVQFFFWIFMLSIAGWILYSIMVNR